MSATFNSLFRQWQLVNEAASTAEAAIQKRLLAAHMEGGPLPEQHHIDAARTLRAKANELMDATFVAVKSELPGWTSS